MKNHSYNFKNLTGQKFGRLTVVSLDKNIKGKIYWLCKCDCGKIVSVLRSSLTSGNTKSCGCYKRNLDKKRFRKHGMTNTRIYRIWSGMKKRCNNPKDSNYNFYGGRNIKVCEDWEKNFINFYNWAMANGYKEDLTIDRINNNGNYEPSNCRWITQAEQTRNERSNVRITIDGKTKLLSEWARESGIDRRTIAKRIRLGWQKDELLNQVDKNHKNKRTRRRRNANKKTNNNISRITRNYKPVRLCRMERNRRKQSKRDIQ